MRNPMVRADVFDISFVTPSSADQLLVDTNVWIWYSYTPAALGASPSAQRGINAYMAFMMKVRAARGTLLRCGLCLAELGATIERYERETFNRLEGGRVLDKKEFRHCLPESRKKVVSEIAAAWSSVCAAASVAEVVISEKTTNAALECYSRAETDGIDAFLLEAVRGTREVQVLTDDIDFVTVPDVHVFTANAKALRLARDQKKLRRGR